jgi:hypothetical protein
MGPSSVAFICLGFIVLSSVSLLLLLAQQEGAVLIDKVHDCSFRLHTILFFTQLQLLDQYLDSHCSIANTHGSPLHYRNIMPKVIQNYDPRILKISIPAFMLLRFDRYQD